MRILLAAFVVLGTGCAADRPQGFPFPEFVGEYRIVDAEGESAWEQIPPLGALSRMRALTDRMRRSLASSLGTVQVRPAVGGEYVEWNIAMDEPAHEIRRMLGPRNVDGSFPIWRFEQQPAPAVAVDGVVRIDHDEMIADFQGTTPARAFVLRERWRLVDDGTLEFALEAGPDPGSLARVGGFTAVRQ
jgi:hypothetical protein